MPFLLPRRRLISTGTVAASGERGASDIGLFSNAAAPMSSPVLSRRDFPRGAGALFAALVLRPPARALAQITQNSGNFVNLALPPYSADRTGRSDSGVVAQAALNQLQSVGGGTLYIPEGEYWLETPVQTSGASISVVGDGQALTVCRVTHSQTALSITCNSNSDAASVTNIGFSPCPSGGGAAGTGIALAFPTATSGWQHCIVQAVDLGVPRPGYTCFSCGISTTNAWRGNFRNINMHGDWQPVSCFASLGGLSIDNRFRDISVDGIQVAIALTEAAQGLHIGDSVFITRTGLSTGESEFSNDDPVFGINLLQLIISNSEFNCSQSALALNRVCQGLITNTHFGSQANNMAACSLTDCANIQFSGCEFSGGFSPTDGVSSFGALVGSGCQENEFDNCSFGNVQIGIVLTGGAANTTGSNLRMIGCGNSSLQTGVVDVNGMPTAPVLDWSGTTTNRFTFWGPTGLINLS